MDIKKKIAAIIAAGAVAVPLLAFAPVPNTTVSHGQYLFAEDGSQVAVHAAGKRYNVAFIPTVEVEHLFDRHPAYHGAIAVLNAKGKIVFFRAMSEAKAVNAYGAFTDNHKRAYASLASLEGVVRHDIRTAHNTY